MSESAVRAPSAPWLVSPVVDVLIGCGLLALPAGLLVAFLADRDASLIVVGSAALALLVNGPHYAATIRRALHHDRRARLVLAAATAVAIVVAVAAHLQPALLAVLVTAFLTWSPLHYATQNHGVTLLLLARAGGPMASTGERRLLQLAHLAAAAAAVVAIHTGLSEAFLWRLGLPKDAMLASAVVAAIVAVGVFVVVLARLRARGVATTTLLLSLALLSTSLIWFVVPGFLGGGSTILYVGGAAALLHGAQALWLAAFIEGRTQAVTGGRFDGLAYAGAVVALGVVLFSLGPWIVSRGFGYDLAVSLLIVQAVVNLHHNVLDAVIWRWRDPTLAGAVLSGRELAPARREAVSNGRAILATVGVGVLVALGVVDVVQLAGTREDADDEVKARAATLNEHDSRLWVVNAQRAVADNNADAARADLGRAVALSPWNVDAQRALLRLHAVADHLDEAWARHDAAPAGVLDDVDSTVALADVALRLERFDDAIRLGRRAVALAAPEPDGAHAIEARRVLGTALHERSENGEAFRLLRSALDDADALVVGDALRLGHVPELGVAMGQVHLALSEWDPAQLLFDRVLEGAGDSDRADIGVLALLGKAAIAMERQRPHESLELLQRALIVADARPGDVSADRIARAWLDYGGLLAASEAPMKHRFVCALKGRQYAERMRKGERQQQLLDFIAEATTFVEEVMPATELEAVRKDVDAAAREALNLAYPDETQE